MVSQTHRYRKNRKKPTIRKRAERLRSICENRVDAALNSLVVANEWLEARWTKLADGIPLLIKLPKKKYLGPKTQFSIGILLGILFWAILIWLYLLQTSPD